MRKNLYYAILLVALSTTAYKAQTQRGVGINTDQPAATLDIKATTTDNTMPDAVLIPRMTATQLNDKNASYIAAQDGALVFVTAGTGTAGTKTALVTGKGFYYFDAAAASNVGRWTAVGGGATGPDKNIYDGDGTLAGPRVVTQNNNNLTFTTGNTGQFIINGTNNIKGAQYMNIRVDSNPTVTVLPDDYMIHLTNTTAGGIINLPPAGTSLGREICFFSEGGLFNNGALGNGGNVQTGYSTCVISNGVIWITKNSF